MRRAVDLFPCIKYVQSRQQQSLVSIYLSPMRTTLENFLHSRRPFISLSVGLGS